MSAACTLYARRVHVYVPAVLGVPVSTPVGSSVRPNGMTPVSRATSSAYVATNG